MLARWFGTWSVASEVSPAKWSPDGDRRKETKTTVWILANRFVQESVRGADYEARVVYGYDIANSVYRAWYFRSDGTTNEWNGNWNAQSNTMTWVSRKDELTWIATVRFLSTDKCELSFVVKDRNAGVLWGSKAVHTCVKE